MGCFNSPNKLLRLLWTIALMFLSMDSLVAQAAFVVSIKITHSSFFIHVIVCIPFVHVQNKNQKVERVCAN